MYLEPQGLIRKLQSLADLFRTTGLSGSVAGLGFRGIEFKDLWGYRV